MSWIKALFSRKPKDFTFVEEVLLNFPSFGIDNRSIYGCLDDNKKLRKLCGNKRPSKQIGKLYTVTYCIDTKLDNEWYPTWSPVTFNIKVIDKPIN